MAPQWNMSQTAKGTHTHRHTLDTCTDERHFLLQPALALEVRLHLPNAGPMQHVLLTIDKVVGLGRPMSEEAEHF